MRRNHFRAGSFGSLVPDGGWWLAMQFPGATSLRQGNRRLNVSLSSPSGSIFQDVPAHGASTGWWFSYGARIWSDVPATATIVVWELPGNQPHVRQIQTGPDRRMVQDWFVLDGNPETLRFEIYFGESGVGYHVDDAFLTQT